jgi:hypothetical protein
MENIRRIYISQNEFKTIKTIEIVDNIERIEEAFYKIDENLNEVRVSAIYYKKEKIDLRSFGNNKHLKNNRAKIKKAKKSGIIKK